VQNPTDGSPRRERATIARRLKRRAIVRRALRALAVISSFNHCNMQKTCLTLESIPRLIMLMVQQTNRKGLHAGALAKAAGVSPDTIRHYEKIGVLTRAPRTQGGYRVYPQSAVERVLSVHRERSGSASRWASWLRS
jgi:hypothetical protein